MLSSDFFSQLLAGSSALTLARGSKDPSSLARPDETSVTWVLPGQARQRLRCARTVVILLLKASPSLLAQEPHRGCLQKIFTQSYRGSALNARFLFGRQPHLTSLAIIIWCTCLVPIPSRNLRLEEARNWQAPLCHWPLESGCFFVVLDWTGACPGQEEEM